MTKEFFERLYDAAQAKAKELKTEAFELYYSGGEDLSAETFRDELASFSAGKSGSLIVRLTVGGKTGCATSTLATPEEAALLVEKAVENAALSEKEEETIYAPGGLQYKEVPEVPFTMPEAAKIKERAMAARNAVYAADKRVSDGAAGAAYASTSEVYLYSDKGLRLSSTMGNSGLYAVSVLQEGEDKRDGFEIYTGDLDKADLEKIAAKATEEASAQFGATVPDSGNYPMVIEGKQMQQILGTFCSVFFGKEAEQGLSLLKGKEGEKIAVDALTLMDDPFYEGNTMQMPFDGEGMPTYTKAVIEKGVLKTLLYNLESGKKAGKASTGNGARNSASIGTTVFNFYIVPGNKSREELFKMAEGGIFVTGMKGFHAGANTVTGDFSIESEGFLIKDGKKGAPIKSFTVSGNFFELLKQIGEIGDKIEDDHPSVSKIRCPDIFFASLPVAGK